MSSYFIYPSLVAYDLAWLLGVPLIVTLMMLYPLERSTTRQKREATTWAGVFWSGWLATIFTGLAVETGGLALFAWAYDLRFLIYGALAVMLGVSLEEATRRYRRVKGLTQDGKRRVTITATIVFAVIAFVLMYALIPHLWSGWIYRLHKLPDPADLVNDKGQPLGIITRTTSEALYGGHAVLVGVLIGTFFLIMVGLFYVFKIAKGRGYETRWIVGRLEAVTIIVVSFLIWATVMLVVWFAFLFQGIDILNTTLAMFREGLGISFSLPDGFDPESWAQNLAFLSPEEWEGVIPTDPTVAVETTVPEISWDWWPFWEVL